MLAFVFNYNSKPKILYTYTYTYTYTYVQHIYNIYLSCITIPYAFISEDMTTSHILSAVDPARMVGSPTSTNNGGGTSNNSQNGGSNHSPPHHLQQQQQQQHQQHHNGSLNSNLTNGLIGSNGVGGSHTPLANRSPGMERNLHVSLDDRELWLRFQNLTNEMIVTKNGRQVNFSFNFFFS